MDFLNDPSRKMSPLLKYALFGVLVAVTAMLVYLSLTQHPEPPGRWMGTITE